MIGATISASPAMVSIEFSLKCIKLATLAIKAYAGKSKINLTKNVTSIGDSI